MSHIVAAIDVVVVAVCILNGFGDCFEPLLRRPNYAAHLTIQFGQYECGQLLSFWCESVKNEEKHAKRKLSIVCLEIGFQIIYLAHKSIPSLSSSLRTRLRFGRMAGESLLWSSLIDCRSGLDAFRLALILKSPHAENKQIYIFS